MIVCPSCGNFLSHPHCSGAVCPSCVGPLPPMNPETSAVCPRCNAWSHNGGLCTACIDADIAKEGPSRSRQGVTPEEVAELDTKTPETSPYGTEITGTVTTTLTSPEAFEANKKSEAEFHKWAGETIEASAKDYDRVLHSGEIPAEVSESVPLTDETGQRIAAALEALVAAASPDTKEGA